MPKMKTKSGAKKRFKVTGTGKVKFGAAGKRHRLFSHSGDFVRQNRRTRVLSDSDVQHVLDWMPYARGKKRKAPAKKTAVKATTAKAAKKTAGGA